MCLWKEIHDRASLGRSPNLLSGAKYCLAVDDEDLLSLKLFGVGGFAGSKYHLNDSRQCRSSKKAYRLNRER